MARFKYHPLVAISGQLNNLELAVNLAKRVNLPGVENRLLELHPEHYLHQLCPKQILLLHFTFPFQLHLSPMKILVGAQLLHAVASRDGDAKFGHSLN
ncbi:hypothetical protein REPUB_Repub06bG0027400 [Reevesia pubescens]